MKIYNQITRLQLNDIFSRSTYLLLLTFILVYTSKEFNISKIHESSVGYSHYIFLNPGPFVKYSFSYYNTTAEIQQHNLIQLLFFICSFIFNADKYTNLNFPIIAAWFVPYLPKVTTKMYGTHKENCFFFTKTLTNHTEILLENHVWNINCHPAYHIQIFFTVLSCSQCFMDLT